MISTSSIADVEAAVRGVLDPELPVISIADLGILRGISVDGDTVVVTITPTYSGCPAMDAIRTDVERACHGAGYDDVEVRTVLSPAWTTDWMTDDGKAALEAYGVAPPGRVSTRSTTERSSSTTELALSVKCPQCSSLDTRELSRFGSTACKALWSCNTCQEPFDHFKTH